MIPDPTVKLLGWVATRAAEAIADRVAERMVTRARTRIVADTRRRAANALDRCRAHAR